AKGPMSLSRQLGKIPIGGGMTNSGDILLQPEQIKFADLAGMSRPQITKDGAQITGIGGRRGGGGSTARGGVYAPATARGDLGNGRFQPLGGNGFGHETVHSGGKMIINLLGGRMGGNGDQRQFAD